MVALTRRQFATTLAGASAGLTFAGRAAAAPAGDDKIPSSVVGGLQFGVQSFTFREFTLDRMIEAMRAVGLSSLELWTGHLDPAKATEADFKTTRAKLDAAGIKVNAFCVNFRPGVTDLLLDKAFRGAGLLGTSLMTTSTEKALLPRLDAWCQKYKITLGLHNHWLGDSWFKGDKAQNFGGPDDFAEGLKGRSKQIAINLDIGHFSAAGYDPVAFFQEHHERILALHVKDRDSDAEHSNRRFGYGATPIIPVLKLAQKLNYKGALNLEYEIEEEDPTEGLLDAFGYVKRALA